MVEVVSFLAGVLVGVIYLAVRIAKRPGYWPGGAPRWPWALAGAFMRVASWVKAWRKNT